MSAAYPTQSANQKTRIKKRILLLAILCTSCAVPASEVPPQEFTAWFDEISADAGIDFQHVRATTNNFYFPEIMAGGIGWLDYDQDGLLDLYVIQAGNIDSPGNPAFTNKLYRNIDGKQFVDVTEEASVGDTGYGMGIAVGDIDNDGDSDLYITNVGPNVLFRNDGNGSFTDISRAAGVDHPGWGSGAAFADFNGDGLLDLYVVNYINWAPHQEIECFSGGAGRDYCHPDNYRSPAIDVLYLNSGEGQFLDVSDTAGISKIAANGLGIYPADYDGDHLIDVYVANDGNPNQLWINKGDMTFEDRALITGTAVNRQGAAEAGMGVAAFDFENDGDTDILITHLRDETNTLYRNDNNGFQDATIAAGLSAPSLPFTGFGISVSDFDNDGFLDLYIANGRVGSAGSAATEDPFAEPNQLFKGLSTGNYEEVPAGGITNPSVATSRGVASADFDNDGDTDIAVVNNHGAAYLLENTSEKEGDWIGFVLQNTSELGAFTSYNARVKLNTDAGSFYRTAQSAGSYQSANDARIRFGLPKSAKILSIEIRWPGGETQALNLKETGRYHEVVRDGL